MEGRGRQLDEEAAAADMAKVGEKGWWKGECPGEEAGNEAKVGVIRLAARLGRWRHKKDGDGAKVGENWQAARQWQG